MDLCSWSMSGVSHKVIFLPTESPNNRRGLLKPLKDLQKLRPDSEDIFMDDKWRKYLDRPMVKSDKKVDFEIVCYKEFYENYRYGTSVRGPNFKDRKGRDVCLRDVKKNKGIIRTRTFNITDFEAAFMQLVMLHWPTRADVDKWIDPNSDIKSYRHFAIAVLGRERIIKLAPHLSSVLDDSYSDLTMADLRSQDQIPDPELELDPLYLTEDQLTAFNCIKDRIENVSNTSRPCQMLITGAAGTGKSTLLKISQSLTLPKAAVSLRNVFTSGQVYVAMSRVRSRNDLYIIDMDLKKIAEVANCVKSRLSKLREESRCIEDEILDTIDDEIGLQSGPISDILKY
ncbi:hypothetical protein BGW38_006687 [Lunasporangiospora selenospora]|uniref:ATP-dependent DNA helicase n=1 Tax=Lunasporangiospora selenospora TaxID=979761 RepID=A0A9P6G398_9FUNG|nr:hypothetical protein BGW38_006687 [Lunasporangiospora selenospora]